MKSSCESRGAGVLKLAVAGIAAFGVLIGHGVAYLLTIPHGGDRHDVLAAGGHAYLPIAFIGAGVAAAVAAVAVVVLAVRLSRDGGGAGSSIRHDAATLSIMQTALFVALELGERVVSSSHAAPPNRVLLIGTAAQLAVAGFGALLLSALDHLGRELAAVVSRRSPRRAGRTPIVEIQGRRFPQFSFTGAPLPPRSPPPPRV